MGRRKYTLFGQSRSRGLAIELRGEFARLAGFPWGHPSSGYSSYLARRVETCIPNEERSRSRCISYTQTANAGHYLMRFVPARGGPDYYRRFTTSVLANAKHQIYVTRYPYLPRQGRVGRSRQLSEHDTLWLDITADCILGQRLVNHKQ